MENSGLISIDHANKLRESMRSSKEEFAFRKTNGSIRLAYGTTNMSMIPEEKHPNGNGKKNDPYGALISFYDVDVNSWRSFYGESLMWSKKYGLSSDLTLEDEKELIQILEC